jgi:tRNA(Arg) A34 adenosine deaminase TadA
MRQSRRHVLKGAGVMCLGLAVRAASARTQDQGNRPEALVPRKSICRWPPGQSPQISDVPLTPAEISQHTEFVRVAIALSAAAEKHCNHPFGALLVLPQADGNGKIVMRAENRVFTDNDPTQHAEYRLVSDASKNQYLSPQQLRQCTLYTSTEPCAMCCGAMFWAGIRKMVYAAPHDAFGSATFRVPSREVFKYAQNGNDVTVIGPILAEESIPIVKTYFDKKVVAEANRCRIALQI